MANQLIFKSHVLETIEHKDEYWLISSALAIALEYAEVDSVTKIYQRNKDEFTSAMTQTVNLTVNGINNSLRKKAVRVFSLRGAHLIAMFASTPVAKEFRKWVLDLIDKEVQQPKPTSEKITLDQQTLIKELVKSRAEALPKDKRAKAAITMWSALKSHFGMKHCLTPASNTDILLLEVSKP